VRARESCTAPSRSAVPPHTGEATVAPPRSPAGIRRISEDDGEKMPEARGLCRATYTNSEFTRGLVRSPAGRQDQGIAGSIRHRRRLRRGRNTTDRNYWPGHDDKEGYQSSAAQEASAQGSGSPSEPSGPGASHPFRPRRKIPLIRLEPTDGAQPRINFRLALVSTIYAITELRIIGDLPSPSLLRCKSMGPGGIHSTDTLRFMRGQIKYHPQK
jgi:hypothetical protein